MENNTKNMFLAVAYKLYAIENGQEDFIEEATTETPYTFLSGFGMVLPAFEDALVGKQKGEKFEIVLDKEQAYGDHDDEAVIELGRDVFCIDGKFDDKRIFPGAVVPLLNEEGQRFQATVVNVDKEHVKVDLNYPLAGKSLKFCGHIVENREATNSEIESLVSQMSGGCDCGCGGGCNNGEGGCNNEGCGCGNEGCSCGDCN
ncbi:peptidylprolyl isomerase [Prevotella sp. OH937_COT-195]|uniref:FKBP-type peptidyl-prolyl cis-trans isomerase n=1 Tax=Prevotella sp. OH937_COT-195 TaxID=2491051 RepID=UPI000F647624|nr:FKBP-type peptidyl-prolyl cis-trans isomerase [Prevotella sp. OH937_COT-195]RRD02794.1 peptidylprolyl isomerase [Prevotella sp. OH937_COT-195]